MKKCIIADRHEEIGKNIGNCFICGKKIGKSFEEKTREKVDATPKETKQKLLDIIWEGKTLGEAMEKCGIKETIVGATIVKDNIGSYQYLRKEVIN